MKAGMAILLAVGLETGVWAGATIEGKVNLSAAARVGAAAGARYQGKPAVGPAEPPAAIVYLEGTFPLGTNAVVEVGQRQYQFAPGMVAVQKGSKVKFPNYDDDYHNVFSLSKAKRFDLGRYRKDEEPASLTFDQAGVIKLYCEIHAHMRGTILVLDTPFFTKTDKDGHFTLKDLPTGSYKLKAWLDEKVVWEKGVDLKDGQTLQVDFAGK